MNDELKKMSFSDHFDELRRRLMVCVISVVALFVVCFIFKDPLKDLVIHPYEALRAKSIAEGEHVLEKLVFINPTEKFVFYLKVCFFISILISGPLILYQMWRFIAAGLYKHERGPVMRVMPVSLILFAVGMAFGYAVLFPIGLEFLIEFGDQDSFSASITMSTYFSLCTLLILVMGFIFQTPLIMVVTTKVGLTSPQFFSAKRKYFILGAFIVSAMLTPPDWVTQCLLAGPLIVLFEIGILLSRMVRREKGRKERREAHEKKEGGDGPKEREPPTGEEQESQHAG